MKRVIGMAVIAAGILASGFLASTASAAPGGEDPTFGRSHGHTINGSPAEKTAVYPGMTLPLTGGSTISSATVENRSALTRRRPDGSLDRTFGRAGTALLPFVNERKLYGGAIARQGTSTLVLASGPRQSRDGSVYVQRFDTKTGKRDRGFGKDGVATVDISDFKTKYDDGTFDAIGLAVDPKRRIYVLSRIESGRSGGEAALVRLTPGGKLDRSFWKQGLVIAYNRGCDVIWDMDITRAGVYLSSSDCIRRFGWSGRLDRSFDYEPFPVGSRISSLQTSRDGSVYIAIGSDPVYLTRVQRLEADGTLDDSFGFDGEIEPDQPSATGYAAFELDERGHLYLFGGTDYENQTLHVARYTDGGDLDESFGTDGLVSFETGGKWESTNPNPIAVDGGVIVSGASWHFGGPGNSSVKVTPDATLDPGFGKDGLLVETAIVPPDDQILTTLAADRGILAGGSSGGKAAVVRYRADGRVDRSFGNLGWLKFQVGSGNYGDRIQSLALGNSGRVFACVDKKPGVAVASIRRNGTLDPNFGVGGVAEVPKVFRCGGIASNQSGRILLGGTRNPSRPVVVRLEKDGTVDESYGEEGAALGGYTVSRGNTRMGFAGFVDGSSLISTPERLTRFGPDGRRTIGFGEDGVASLSIANISRYDDVVALKTDSIGRTLVGMSGEHGGSRILRVTAGGWLDRDFARVGSLKVNDEKDKSELTDFEIQSDGRLIASVGSARRCFWMSGCYEKAKVHRYETNGKPDLTFGRKGLFSTRLGISSRANALTLTPRGIVIGGYADTFRDRNQAMLIRVKK